MPAADATPLSFIGTGSEAVDLLARSLGAGTRATAPVTPAARTWTWAFGSELESWSEELRSLPEAGRVVVCTWSATAPSRRPLVELDDSAWRREVEWPTALWFSTLVAAAGRCRDGGSVVAVVDRPVTIDAVGHSVEVVVAEGVTNVVRSLAAREGSRGVRVNAVATTRETDTNDLLGAPPALATFPGRIDVEVAGAVRLLLSEDAAGLTGVTLTASCGRQ